MMWRWPMALANERPDAPFVGPDGFLASRRVQLVTLTAVNKIPTGVEIVKLSRSAG
jgi:hypothetical protein